MRDLVFFGLVGAGIWLLVSTASTGGQTVTVATSAEPWTLDSAGTYRDARGRVIVDDMGRPLSVYDF